MQAPFHDEPVVARKVRMSVITGHDGGNHPIFEPITLFFMDDGTVRWTLS